MFERAWLLYSKYSPRIREYIRIWGKIKRIKFSSVSFDTDDIASLVVASRSSHNITFVTSRVVPVEWYVAHRQKRIYPPRYRVTDTHLTFLDEGWKISREICDLPQIIITTIEKPDKEWKSSNGYLFYGEFKNIVIF